jgi:hypothetical protein
MSPPSSIENPCQHGERLCAYLVKALPPEEVPALEAHLASCASCRHELEDLRPVVAAAPAWPRDLLRPAASVQERLAQRIAAETGGPAVAPPAAQWSEPAWRDVAPGIACKILARDAERQRVSMLVRLAPGTEYPPHVHAGVEELHLLDGELWIDDRKLVAGDDSRAEPGTRDRRVFSETGCTCVLVTSPDDELG